MLQLIQNHCICWAANARSSAGSSAASTLSVVAYPYTALLVPFEGKARLMFYSAGTRAVMARRKMGDTVLHVLIAPPLSPSSFSSCPPGLLRAPRMLEGLTQALEDSEAILATERADRAARQQTHSLRQEQDDAYLASLAADKKKVCPVAFARRWRPPCVRAVDSSRASSPPTPFQEEERQRAQEEEERLAREQAAKEAEAAKHAERRQETLAKKRAALAEEPGADVEGHVKIAVQMPDGRIARRFRSTDTIQAVYDFVDVQEKVGGMAGVPLARAAVGLCARCGWHSVALLLILHLLFPNTLRSRRTLACLQTSPSASWRT